MTTVQLRHAFLLSLVFVACVACSDGDGSNTERADSVSVSETSDGSGAATEELSGGPSTPPDAGATMPRERECGPIGVCPSEALCVRTRGAVCMPLPPPGKSCLPECTRTPHCCNCPAFACIKPPRAACADGVGCDCIDETPALQNCPSERRECTETPAGVDVLCINVDFDEDPFSDAGAAESHGQQ